MKALFAAIGVVAVLVIAVAVAAGWFFYRNMSTGGSGDFQEIPLTTDAPSGLASSFQQGFDKSFRSSCQTEAMKKGADQELATKYCECALTQFKETKSMEKATTTCAAQVRQGN